MVKKKRFFLANHLADRNELNGPHTINLIETKNWRSKTYYIDSRCVFLDESLAEFATDVWVLMP